MLIQRDLENRDMYFVSTVHVLSVMNQGSVNTSTHGNREKFKSPAERFMLLGPSRWPCLQCFQYPFKEQLCFSLISWAAPRKPPSRLFSSADFLPKKRSFLYFSSFPSKVPLAVSWVNIYWSQGWWSPKEQTHRS